jgi:hypothetical protein
VALVITAGVSLLSGISWVLLVGRFEQVVWSHPTKSDSSLGGRRFNIS